MTTDTCEKGLETIIMRHMTGTDGLDDIPEAVSAPPAFYGGTGYLAGRPKDYERAHALGCTKALRFSARYAVGSPSKNWR